MQTHQLVHHRNFAPANVKGVSVRWSELPGGRLMLRYRVDGCESILLPDFKGKGRGDNLWETTCFELFLHDGNGEYREYNFSPSQQWAAYRFRGYRSRREDFEPVVLPEIKSEQGDHVFMLTVFISLEELAGAEAAALCAIVQEQGQRPSYWAMVHNRLKPDFHDPAGFRLRLRAADAA